MEKIRSSSLTPELVKSINEMLEATHDLNKICTKLKLNDTQQAEARRLLFEKIKEEKRKGGNNVNKVSICFLLDGTGSMNPYIKMARIVVGKLMEEVINKFTNYEIYFGIVVYRDFDKAEKSFDTLNFTNQKEKVQTFLDGIECSGGKDAPEDIFGGFQKMLELDWKEGGINLLFHIADCPCHGTKFHDLEDSFPKAQSESDWKKLFTPARQQFRINYFFLEINKKATEKMCNIFRELWYQIEIPTKITKSTYKVQEITKDVSEFFNILMNSIIQSVSTAY